MTLLEPYRLCETHLRAYDKNVGCPDCNPVAQGHTRTPPSESRDDPKSIKKIKIKGKDFHGNEIEEEIELNGTSPVTSENEYYIMYPWDYNLPELPDKEEAKKQCDHMWKTYHGLIEIFDYCEYCDVRREDYDTK